MSECNDCEPAISIGDLVRLRNDADLSNGIGLVLDRRDDTAEIVRDFVEQLGVSPDDDKDFKDALKNSDEYLLNTSVFLVHWQGGGTRSLFRNIWMFYSEIELLSKADINSVKKTEK